MRAKHNVVLGVEMHRHDLRAPEPKKDPENVGPWTLEHAGVVDVVEVPDVRVIVLEPTKQLIHRHSGDEYPRHPMMNESFRNARVESVSFPSTELRDENLSPSELSFRLLPLRAR
jgi:hypothetical protein